MRSRRRVQRPQRRVSPTPRATAFAGPERHESHRVDVRAALRPTWVLRNARARFSANSSCVFSFPELFFGARKAAFHCGERYADDLGDLVERKPFDASEDER